MDTTNIEILKNRYDGENEASMALFLDCVMHGCIGLANKVAGIVIDVQDKGNMTEDMYERCREIYDSLKKIKNICTKI